MKKISGVLVMMVLVAGSVSAAELRQETDARRCSNKSLSGVYGFRFDGSAPFAFLTVGVNDFDGQGHFTATESINVGGVSVPSSFSGTYSINANCTGTLTAQFDNGMTGNLYLSIVHGGDDVYAMFTDPGVTAAGSFARQ